MHGGDRLSEELAPNQRAAVEGRVFEGLHARDASPSACVRLGDPPAVLRADRTRGGGAKPCRPPRPSASTDQRRGAFSRPVPPDDVVKNDGSLAEGCARPVPAGKIVLERPRSAIAVEIALALPGAFAGFSISTSTRQRGAIGDQRCRPAIERERLVGPGMTSGVTRTRPRSRDGSGTVHSSISKHKLPPSTDSLSSGPTRKLRRVRARGCALFRSWTSVCRPCRRGRR